MWNAVITAVFLGTMLFDGAVLQRIPSLRAESIPEVKLAS
jgi:hypothetical protein